MNREKKEVEMFTFVDLFAGIGGLRIPFGRTGLGGRCVYSSEKDKFARETYLSNFGHEDENGHEFNEDIREVYDSPAGFCSIPDHDLLLAGFPCQPYSMAGKRQGSQDERALFDAVYKTVEAKRPSVVLLENVRGLKSIEQGETLRQILMAIRGLDYFVPDPVILNARDFGLPQNRNRLFIVAIRKDLADFALFEFPKPTHDRNLLSVSAVLDPDPDPSLTISDKLWAGHRLRKLKNVEAGKGFGYQAVTAASPYTATISARYHKDGSEILVLQEGQNPRKLSVREAARLQGFPEDFKFGSSNVQAYKQLGNAVPVAVVSAIAQKLQRFLVLH